MSPRRLITFLPETQRQWAGAIAFVLMAIIGTWQGTVYTYKQRLREIEEREWKFWAMVSKDSESALIVVDCGNGRITGWNPAATQLLGWTPDEVIDRTFLFLVPEEYIRDKYGSISKYFERVIDSKSYSESMGTVKIIKGYINTKSGKRLKCRISVRTIGGGSYFYVVVVDKASTVEEIAPEVHVQIHPDKAPMPPSTNFVPMTGVP